MPQPGFLTAQLVVSTITILIVVHVILLGVAYLIYVERKIASYVQDRIGPNRVGFDFGLPALKFLRGCIGLGQPLADGLKFLLKEDYMPRGADRVLFTLAPAVIIVPALIGFAVIPWGGAWRIDDFTIPFLGWTIEGGIVQVAGANINIGIVYLLAVASLGIYGVVLGGWASNNKYSFLGGLRASAQMISYEIPLGLSLLAVLLIVGSLVPSEIIAHQVDSGWGMLAMPLVGIVFFLCILAEANRLPFDNAECESELVGGYHTEYSSMRFALFFLAEYAHMITSSAFFVLLFLGGYHLPFVPGLGPEATGLVAVFAKFGVFSAKIFLVICLTMFIRWTIPRLRYDQVMSTAWQGVIPLSLALVVVTAFMVYFDLVGWLPLLVSNVAVLAVYMAFLPMLQTGQRNKKIRMAGSRFHPLVEGEVATAPTDPMAREDRPEQGTVVALEAR